MPNNRMQLPSKASAIAAGGFFFSWITWQTYQHVRFPASYDTVTLIFFAVAAVPLLALIHRTVKVKYGEVEVSLTTQVREAFTEASVFSDRARAESDQLAERLSLGDADLRANLVIADGDDREVTALEDYRRKLESAIRKLGTLIFGEDTIYVALGTILDRLSRAGVIESGDAKAIGRVLGSLAAAATIMTDVDAELLQLLRADGARLLEGVESISMAPRKVLLRLIARAAKRADITYDSTVSIVRNGRSIRVPFKVEPNILIDVLVLNNGIPEDIAKADEHLQSLLGIRNNAIVVAFWRQPDQELVDAMHRWRIGYAWLAADSLRGDSLALDLVPWLFEL